MSEAPETRLKRLKMRAWRRGTKEMDLILGPYADARLAALPPAALDAFEALLEENDQDLFPWITGQVPAPAAHAALLAEIAGFARIRPRCAIPSPLNEIFDISAESPPRDPAGDSA